MNECPDEPHGHCPMSDCNVPVIEVWDVALHVITSHPPDEVVIEMITAVALNNAIAEVIQHYPEVEAEVTALVNSIINRPPHHTEDATWN